MSWINEIKLARWIDSLGLSKAQAEGVNLIGLGATAVDNPNFQTTMADGSIVTGRTEIAFPQSGPTLMWQFQDAPGVAALRYLSNYGSWFAAPHAKIVPRQFVIKSIQYTAQGTGPSVDSLTIQLYHNNAVVPGFSLVIPGGVAAGYFASVSPVTPFTTGNGCLIGLGVTQSGAQAATFMRGNITVG